MNHRINLYQDIGLLAIGGFVATVGTFCLKIDPIAWFVISLGVLLMIIGLVFGRRWIELSDDGVTAQFLWKQEFTPWDAVANCRVEVADDGMLTLMFDFEKGHVVSIPITEDHLPTLASSLLAREDITPSGIISVRPPLEGWLDRVLDYWTPLMAFGFGCFFGVLSIMVALEVYHGSRSKDWPTTQGVVDQATVETRSSKGGHSSREKIRYSPVVRYRYEVDGKEYVGDRVSFSSAETKDRDAAYRFVTERLDDPNVSVSYDPAAHDESVLIAGVEDGRKAAVTLSALASLGGLVFGGYHLVKLRRAKT